MRDRQLIQCHPMKRHNHLWKSIVSFENLLQAARQAQKGKRFRDNVLEFNYNLEAELLQLQTELQTQTYQPGEYRTFQIYEPKPRMISAAPYRDRVVHHALCNTIVPIFDRTFIHTSYAMMRRRGLPIGNLTSQFLANCYLNGLDHFVTQTLGVRAYLRYVDDFVLFSDDRDILVNLRPPIETYLAGLRLKIHPIKSQIFATRIGANFVGFRVFPDRIRVRSDNLRRSRLRLQRLQKSYQAGTIDQQRRDASWQSWMAHLAHGDTWRLRAAGGDRRASSLPLPELD